MPFTVQNGTGNFDDGRVNAARGRATFPVLLTVDEAATLLRTTRRAIYAILDTREATA